MCERLCCQANSWCWPPVPLQSLPSLLWLLSRRTRVMATPPLPPVTPHRPRTASTCRRLTVHPLPVVATVFPSCAAPGLSWWRGDLRLPQRDSTHSHWNYSRNLRLEFRHAVEMLASETLKTWRWFEPPSLSFFFLQQQHRYENSMKSPLSCWKISRYLFSYTKPLSFCCSTLTLSASLFCVNFF